MILWKQYFFVQLITFKLIDHWSFKLTNTLASVLELKGSKLRKLDHLTKWSNVFQEEYAN